MSDTDNGLTADTSGTFTTSDYVIAEEDQHLADEILSLDPIADVKGSGSIVGSVNIPQNLPLSTLPPEAQTRVRDKLAWVPVTLRAEKEAELVRQELVAYSRENRARIGIDPAAPPYHRELAAIANDYREADREYRQIVAQLTEVAHYDRKANPQTGETEAVPVYRASGDRRAALDARLQQLTYRMNLLADADGQAGPEAIRRLDKALFDSVEAAKALRAQREEHNEASQMANKMLRDERVAAKAKAFASRKRNSL